MTDAPLPAAPPLPGLLISFEGGDGVGKTTQIKRLATVFAAARIDYRLTREPGGTELGARIRRLLLHGGAVDPRAEALLYAADRAQHVAELIRPALGRSEVVLTDRYLDSSIAYQGAARSLGAAEVRSLSEWATGSLLPDLTILLDADPSVADRRTGARGAKDRMESEGAAFRAALREQFLALADAEPERFAVLDARRTIEEVAEDVNRRIAALLMARPGAVSVGAPSRGAVPDAHAAFLRAAARLSGPGGERA
ncbi:dTMP kinase [Actinomyces gaoshouyii]|uniref:dTMP kinase n=1 Tax=Actinomyces gaoshouyii TaxID=1960083 RepID=UPI0009C121D4|nr:dTMP kinase [Actinomyces gaoshouyii]ARD42415.1 dTMP kinase [Actinomyces gaoshouyii]